MLAQLRHYRYEHLKHRDPHILHRPLPPSLPLLTTEHNYWGCHTALPTPLARVRLPCPLAWRLPSLTPPTSAPSLPLGPATQGDDTIGPVIASTSEQLLARLLAKSGAACVVTVATNGRCDSDGEGL